MSVICIESKKQVELGSFSVKKILTILSVWQQRSRMRHQLGQLPDYRLEDLGITQEEALLESRKPFWEK